MSSDGAVSYVDSRCYSHRNSIISSYSADDPILGASLFNLNEAQNSLFAKESIELQQRQEESSTGKLVALDKMERGLRIISAMAFMPSTGLPFSCCYSLPESGLFLNGERLTFIVREGQSGAGVAGGKTRMRQLRRGIQRLLNLDLTFEVTFSHGIFVWTVSRKWSHWRRLYPLLLASGLLPHMGPKPRREHGTSTIEASSQQQHRRDSTVSAVLDSEEFKRARFEEQLKKILDKLDSLDRALNLLKFLGVSRLSFVRGVGGKCGEAEVGVFIQRYAASPLTGCQSCIGLFARKKTMWMVIKERCIVFLKDNLSEVNEVFLLDSTCLIINGLDPSMRNYLSGFVLKNASMLMIIQCDYGDYPMLAAEMTRIKELLFKQHQSMIEQPFRRHSQRRHRQYHEHQEDERQQQQQQLELVVEPQPEAQGGSQHNFGSFAGTRANCPAKWYVDGATYFADVCDALEQAAEEIFICGWWLTPEVHLKRPDDDGHHRLMKVLQRRADAGVRIFILIYKEVKYALKIDSWYTKLILRSLNKRNIHVLRHPDHLSSWEFLWAHHEKLVVIDQKLAFVGGIDLCWGRWDTQQHQIADLGDSDWTKYPPLIPALTSLHSPTSSRRTDLRRAAWLHKLQESQHFSRLYESNAYTPQGTIQVKPAPNLSSPNSNASDSDSDCSAVEPGGFTGPAGMDRISELSSAESDAGGDGDGVSDAMETRRTVLPSTERAEVNKAQKQQPQPQQPQQQLPDRSWSRASAVSNRIRQILRRGGESGSGGGGGGDGVGDSAMLRRFASSAEGADAAIAAATAGADIEAETAMARRAEDDRRLVADTPDAKRLKDGQIQVRHHDPVMQRMGNFLRSNAERRRVTRDVRERLRRGEQSSGILELDPNFAIRPDEAAKIRMWRGKDYVNWILKEPVRLHLPDEELIDRGRVPRMPWHDIGCVVGGNAARDAARHFIERWNFTVKSKSGCQLPLLIPKALKPEPAVPDNSDLEPEPENDATTFGGQAKPKEPKRTFLGLLDRLNAQQQPASQQQQQQQYQLKSDPSRTDSKLPSRQPPLPLKSIAPKFSNRVNVLRSMGMWSGGIEEPETSVLNAMCDAIDRSEHYVYIENQFFISCADESLGRKWPVQNPIASRLVQRIVRASREGRQFRVYLVLPLLPQFEGDVAEGPSSADPIKKILHHTYACLCRSENSMMAQLSDAGIQASNYLSVCALRTWGRLADGELTTELIYVHSKLMIVDDRIAIIGSANINDRSLLGYRDSELAVRFEDTGSDLSPVEWQSQSATADQTMVGAFCGSLRRCLMREHLGVGINQALADPTSDQFFHQVWSATARRNTELFEQVFHCYPTDKACNYKELRQWISEPGLATTNREQALHKLENEVRGFLVEFPLNFLDGVSLDFQVGRISKASVLPLITWL